MRAPILVAALAIVAGCARIGSFVYGPTPPTRRADAPGQIDGHVAAIYPVPAGAPRGEVELAVERLTTIGEQDGRHWRTVHVVVVRMVVHNRDGQVWSVDNAGLEAVLGGTQHEYPVRAYCDSQPLWVLVLEPGETRTVDLYYELPEKVARPSVAVEWRVDTPTGPITRTTTAVARRETSER